MMTSKVRRIDANFDTLLQQMAARINQSLPPEHQLSVLELTNKLADSGIAPNITIVINTTKKTNKRGRPTLKDIMEGI